ncbi:hypothetical protein [Bradyrhizobium sp. S3.5.5]|uniref:TRAFAC clade GTPase domain-containing protein n=1 Tax=unclassified Bradyrhizobium TaxID=2631580 RepID=UPI0033944FF6
MDGNRSWLSKQLPLLDQFLRNGEIATEVRMYGVSAQGGLCRKKAKLPLPSELHYWPSVLPVSGSRLWVTVRKNMTSPIQYGGCAIRTRQID